MDVCIIGAGAAGLISSIFSAKSGNKVTILEHTKNIGSKIKITGNGKCNITNSSVSKDKYNNPDFVQKVLNNFSYNDTKNFFEECGLLFKENNGYCYPLNEQSVAVTDVLSSELFRHNINVITDININNITRENEKFYLEVDCKSNNDVVVYSLNSNGVKCMVFDKIIIATGGQSFKKTGSNGSGYKLAQSFGHSIVDLSPGLTGLICDDNIFKAIRGVRVKGKVDLYIDGTLKHQESGEIQMAEYGLSGIPVFNCSNSVSKDLIKNKEVFCTLDFLPQFTCDELKKFVNNQLRNNKSVLFSLKALLNMKVAQYFYDIARNNFEKNSPELIDCVIKFIKEYKVKVTDIRDYEFAQITCGGIDTLEINPNTMESLLVNGLFFAGEIIDISGFCGGYNLQFAWSTGAIAGINT